MEEYASIRAVTIIKHKISNCLCQLNTLLPSTNESNKHNLYTALHNENE